MGGYKTRLPSLSKHIYWFQFSSQVCPIHCTWSLLILLWSRKVILSITTKSARNENSNHLLRKFFITHPDASLQIAKVKACVKSMQILGFPIYLRFWQCKNSKHAFKLIGIHRPCCFQGAIPMSLFFSRNCSEGLFSLRYICFLKLTKREWRKREEDLYTLLNDYKTR